MIDLQEVSVKPAARRGRQFVDMTNETVGWGQESGFLAGTFEMVRAGP
jgi:hypothetical protein